MFQQTLKGREVCKQQKLDVGEGGKPHRLKPLAEIATIATGSSSWRRQRDSLAPYSAATGGDAGVAEHQKPPPAASTKCSSKDAKRPKISFQQEKIKPLALAFLATLRLSSAHMPSNSLAQLTSFVRSILFACYCAIALTLLLIFILGLNHIILTAVQQQQRLSLSQQQQHQQPQVSQSPPSHAPPADRAQRQSMVQLPEQRSFTSNSSAKLAPVNSQAWTLLLFKSKPLATAIGRLTRIKRLADFDLALTNQRQQESGNNNDDELLLPMESAQRQYEALTDDHQINQRNDNAVRQPQQQHHHRHHHNSKHQLHDDTPLTAGRDNKLAGDRLNRESGRQRHRHSPTDSDHKVPPTEQHSRLLVGKSVLQTANASSDSSDRKQRHRNNPKASDVVDDTGARSESISARRIALKKETEPLYKSRKLTDDDRMSFRDSQTSRGDSGVASEGQWIPMVIPATTGRIHADTMVRNSSRPQAHADQHHTFKPVQYSQANPLELSATQAQVSESRLKPPMRAHQNGNRLQMPPSSQRPVASLNNQNHHYHHQPHHQPSHRRRPAQRHPAKPHRHNQVDLKPAHSVHHHHYFYHPPERPRQWRRRPRLNPYNFEAPRGPSKMYKRVLVCDKTLVSLDYVRNLPSEPRPYAGIINEHEINEIADNFLDFDGNFDSGNALIDRSDKEIELVPLASSSSLSTASNATQTPPPTDFVSTTTTTTTTTGSRGGTGGAPISTTPGSLEASESHINSVDRSFYLSDEDPLVRCDMWDLEKGLKSRKPPKHILRMAIKADFDTVRDAINRCRQLSERTYPQEDEYRDGLDLISTDDLISLFSMKRGLIPGTKWCGLGDQANTYNDLGPKHRIDICCRAHDHCPIRSKPFRNDYGVLNIGLYTKSHCDCDADFYRCLREVRSRTADMLGNLYFNVMKLQCMREERLKVCREFKTIALGFERCVRYEDSPIKTVFKFTTPPVAY